MSVDEICPKADTWIRIEGKLVPSPSGHAIFRGRCNDCGVWEYRCVMCLDSFFRRYRARHVEPTCSPRCRKRLQRDRDTEKSQIKVHERVFERDIM